MGKQLNANTIECPSTDIAWAYCHNANMVLFQRYLRQVHRIPDELNSFKRLL